MPLTDPRVRSPVRGRHRLCSSIRSERQKSARSGAKVSGYLHVNQGAKMKSRLILAAGAACLLAVATAHSQSLQQEGQSPGQPTVQPATQQNAAGPAQSGTEASYGRIPATRSAAGGIQSMPWTLGPQWDN